MTLKRILHIASVMEGMVKMKDITGLKFGRLTVIEPLERRNSNGAIMWKCKCDCGNTTTVRNSYLLRNLTKSCGCFTRGIPSKENNNNQKYEVNLKGQQIGLWTVLSKAKKSNDGYGYWNVRCKCGHTKQVMTCNLKNYHSQGCLKCRQGPPKVIKMEYKDGKVINLYGKKYNSEGKLNDKIKKNSSFKNR